MSGNRCVCLSIFSYFETFHSKFLILWFVPAQNITHPHAHTAVGNKRFDRQTATNLNRLQRVWGSFVDRGNLWDRDPDGGNTIPRYPPHNHLPYWNTGNGENYQPFLTQEMRKRKYGQEWIRQCACSIFAQAQQTEVSFDYMTYHFVHLPNFSRRFIPQIIWNVHLNLDTTIPGHEIGNVNSVHSRDVYSQFQLFKNFIVKIFIKLRIVFAMMVKLFEISIVVFIVRKYKKRLN